MRRPELTKTVRGFRPAPARAPSPSPPTVAARPKPKTAACTAPLLAARERSMSAGKNVALASANVNPMPAKANPAVATFGARPAPAIPAPAAAIEVATVEAAAFLDYKSRAECQPYVTRTVDTLEQSRALIADRRSAPDAVFSAVVVDGQVVGDIGGRRYRPESLGPEPDVYDFYLGYSVNPDHWNRGYATAATALLMTALHDAGIRRIVAKTFAENTASMQVLTKTGFRLEGTERCAVMDRDGYIRQLARWL